MKKKIIKKTTIKKISDIELPESDVFVPSVLTKKDSINIYGNIPSGVKAEYSIVLLFGETYSYTLTTDGAMVNFGISYGGSEIVPYGECSPGDTDGTFTVPTVKDVIRISFISADSSTAVFNLTISH